ncbi:unnamed protein product, partial [Allacma fusca]
TLAYHTYDVRDEVANDTGVTIPGEFSKIGKAYLAVCHHQGVEPLISANDLAKVKRDNSPDQTEEDGSVAKQPKLETN